MDIEVPQANIQLQNVTAFVNVESLQNRVLPLQVQFGVNLPWSISPQSIRLLGVPNAQEAIQLRVSNPSDASFRVLDARADSDYLETTCKSELGVTWVEVAVRFKPASGIERGQITITTNNQRMPERRVPFELVTHSRFSIIPRAITLNDFTSAHEIVVSCKTDFSIANVKTLPDCFSAFVLEDAPRDKKIAVRADANSSEEFLRGTISFTLIDAHQNEELATIPLTYVPKGTN